MTLVEELKWRGLIKDISSPELEEKLNKGELTFYIGTDPTADSLHVGHLSSFLISKRLKGGRASPNTFSWWWNRNDRRSEANNRKSYDK